MLPFNGEVYYYSPIVSSSQADDWFNYLYQNIQWQQDQLKIYGKIITTRRKVAWYGDQPWRYTYSKTTKHAFIWTPELLAIKNQVEQVTGELFNACLLNLYHQGAEGMSWHSDGEQELIPQGVIASLSLGAERKFSFKDKTTKQRIDIWLEHASVLTMQGETQAYWQHCLPPTKKIHQPRINLTFRQMLPQKVS